MRPRPWGFHRVRVALTPILLATVLCGVGCPPRAAPQTTAVFLVRHAEKATGVEDPSLTSEGRVRAQALAHVLADAGIETIYSTEFSRTRETAEAVSKATGLEVRIFPVGDRSVDAFIEDMATDILDRQTGRTVLVVGHSNTVPALMRALGATKATDLTEKDYDDLFLVELEDSGSVRLLQLHYGALSP